jgi:hypothetical protein
MAGACCESFLHNQNNPRDAPAYSSHADDGRNVAPKSGSQTHLPHRLAAAVSYDKAIVIELGPIDECAGRCLAINLKMKNQTERPNEQQEHGETDRPKLSCMLHSHLAANVQAQRPPPDHGAQIAELKPGQSYRGGVGNANPGRLQQSLTNYKAWSGDIITIMLHSLRLRCRQSGRTASNETGMTAESSQSHHPPRNSGKSSLDVCQLKRAVRHIRQSRMR